MAGGTAVGHRQPSRQRWIPGADADRLRRLCDGAGERPRAAVALARGRRHRSPCDPRAGAAADLSGRVRLHRLRADGRAARARSVHPRTGRSDGGPRVRLRRLALSALALRTAVHARELRDGATGAGRRVVDAQSCHGRVQPRRGLADGAGGRATRRLSVVRDGVRGTEPGAARAGRRRRAQRHAADRRARAGAAVERGRRAGRTGCRRPSAGPRAPACRGARAERRRRRQADSRPDAAVPRAGPSRDVSPPPRGARRRARAGSSGGGRRDRLWPARARLPDRDRRAAAVGGDAQHPGGDGAPVRPDRHAGLVAAAVGGRLPGGAPLRAVAHGPRRGLASGGGLGDAGAAGLDRLAAAVVRRLGAAASGRLRRSAPACRHADPLRLRRPDPPAAGRPAAQPRRRPRRAAQPQRRLARAARSR
jgi:hypothetical protein